jgi:replicative DNA helicase
MNDRLPPHDIVAEQAVLGCLMLHHEDAVDFVDRHQSGERLFSDLRHQTVFRIIRDLVRADVPATVLSVGQTARSKGLVEETGGRSYVANDLCDAGTPGALSRHEKRLVSLLARRRAIEAAHRIENAAHDESADIRGIIDSALASAEETGANQGATLGDHADDFISDMQTRLTGGSNAVKFGFGALDAMLRGGIRPGELMVVAAATSAGKSALALHLAVRTAMEGSAVGFVSLEMSGSEIFGRAASLVAQVPVPEDADTLSESQQRRFLDGLARVRKLPIAVHDRGDVDIARLRRIALSWKRTSDIKLLIIDYLGLMRPTNPKAPRYEQVSEISRGLKQLAVELKLPVVALSQVNREGAKSDQLRLYNLRDSGSVEQDASSVLLLTQKGQDKAGEREILADLAKNRNGRTGEATLFFRPATMAWSPVRAA